MFKIDLSTNTVIAWVDYLPAAIATLPIGALADIGGGVGYWPKRIVMPTYDPAAETIAPDPEIVPIPELRVVEERFRRTPLPAEAVELKLYRAAATERVNREAGEARARFVTVTTGQEGTYIEKAKEARAFMSDPAPSPDSYPYLAAEARHAGGTMAQIAALVDETERQWTLTNAEIEGLRRGANARIAGARNAAMIDDVFPIAWPSP